MQFWVEKTFVTSRQDRLEGEFAFGEALWSPQTGKDGRDTYRLMREVKPGDVVFHLVDNNALVGVSLVAEERDDTAVVPERTQWPAGKPAFLIRLHNFTKLAQPIVRSDYLAKPKFRSRLLEIVSKHDSLFYSSKLELNQGAYLTIAPIALIKIWDEIYSQKTGSHLPLIDTNLFSTLPETALQHVRREESASETASVTQDKAKEYLWAFKKEANAWFAKATFVQDYFEFFRTFFERDNLEMAEWADIQKIGDHLHCFQSMALAKARALGNPNHPIEHYRKSFIYLAHGPGEPVERIRRFSDDSEYRLDYFGKSAVSELVGYLFPEQFMFVNARDQFAAELLGITVEKQAGGDLVSELIAFSNATRPVAKQYDEIVGRVTDLPLNLEVDQFFSWLYEARENKKPEPPVPPGTVTEMPAAIAYWWLNANPKIWDFRTAPVGSLQTYTSRNEAGNKRQKFKYFSAVKPGDLLIGYITSPDKEIVAICEITKTLHGPPGNEEIEFRKIEQFAEPVTWDELQSVPALQNCEPLLSNQGSLFAVTGEEFDAIRALIDERNVGSNLPSHPVYQSRRACRALHVAR